MIKRRDPRSWRKWRDSGAVAGVKRAGSSCFYIVTIPKLVTPTELLSYFEKLELRLFTVEEFDILFVRSKSALRPFSAFDPKYSFLSFRDR